MIMVSRVIEIESFPTPVLQQTTRSISFQASPLRYPALQEKYILSHLSHIHIFSSYLPCWSNPDHEEGLLRIEPCIAQRGGKVFRIAFGFFAGEIFVGLPLLFHHSQRLECGCGEEVV